MEVGNTHRLAILLFSFLLCPSFASLPEARKNLFILSYNHTCNDDRTVLRAVQESRVLSEVVEVQMNEVVQEVRARRLSAATSQDETTAVNYSTQRLSEMSWEARRDYLISVLSIASQNTHERRFLQTSSSGHPSSISKRFLPNLAMDIIEDVQLENGRLLDVANGLPCLAFPPEKNKMGTRPPVVRQNNRVLNAEERVTITENAPSTGAATDLNDFNAVAQWGLSDSYRGIWAPKAWRCLGGSEERPVISIFDDGCSAVPDLEDNLCKPDDACYGTDLIDTENPNPFNAYEDHGTAVAGAAAATGNNEYGITGSCPTCLIMCIKGWDDLAHTAAAADFIVSKSHITKIAVFAIVFYEESHALYAAFRGLHRAAVLVLAGAGNQNCNINFNENLKTHCVDEETGELHGAVNPASYGSDAFDNVLSVGSSNRSNHRASYSSFGDKTVHFFVPSENIPNLCDTTKSETAHCVDELGSGTSLAAPIAGGVAGALKLLKPDITYLESKEIMLLTVRQKKTLKGLSIVGGILDFGAAVEELLRRLGQQCSLQPFRTLPRPTVNHANDYKLNPRFKPTVAAN